MTGPNQASGAGPTNMASQLAALINSTAVLQGSDGVVAEDVSGDTFGRGTFNLRVRTPGYEAAAVKVLLGHSAGLYVTPPNQAALNNNISDLQPRDHLYVTAGSPRLGVTFSLDTTALADGF